MFGERDYKKIINLQMLKNYIRERWKGATQQYFTRNKTVWAASLKAVNLRCPGHLDMF